MTSASVQLYKIYYDASSHAQIGAPYIPLDNQAGPSGWFEMYPILTFLENNTLKENVWYGFFSPKFPEKAGFSLQAITDLLDRNPNAEVALFSSRWMYLIWYDNVWLQGEEYHPGLIECAEAFLRTQGVTANLHDEIGDFKTSVFSNYIIAKKSFWDDWKKLARAYYDYVENSDEMRKDSTETFYVGPSSYSLKTFVQERLASWLLTQKDYNVITPNYLQLDIPGLPANIPARPLRFLLSMTYKCKAAARQKSWPGAKLCFKTMRKLTASMHDRTLKPYEADSTHHSSS